MQTSDGSKRRSRPSLKLARAKWGKFWRFHDPLLAYAGESGELAVARFRLAVVGVVLVLSVAQLLQNPSSTTAVAGLIVVGLATVAALIVYAIAQRKFYRLWFGFMTSFLDVTIVSAALVALLVVGRPDIAANSSVIFSGYFIAVAAMALRNDPRICALAGLVGLLEYGAIVAYADLQWNLSSPVFAASPYGRFDLTAHYGRLLLFASAVFLSTTVVLRTQRLRLLAAKDPLTLLMNRGTFDERMQAEVARSGRHNHALSVAMIDIDHFKEFNDSYGHIVGDEVLRVIGGLLPKSLRQSDLVARYGGEEFIVLFPETPVEGAVVKAEELRRSIEQSSVTVSIGVAELPADGSDMRTVIDRADQRLYEAKRGGRNRVVGPVVQMVEEKQGV
jgi:diguanylate cyclase (GGDEF)-like protein